jgi:predicted cation transporter
VEIIVMAIPQEPIIGIATGLFVILGLVLILPFKVKKIEQNLEPFFLVMGIAAVTISGLWSFQLVEEAVKAPVMIGGIPVGIFQVVLIAGLVIFKFNKPFYKGINNLAAKLGPKIFIFTLIVLVGLVSSVISVIVASVILSEIIAALPFERFQKIKLTVITCFALGLGAVLTPVGEPLATIAIAKLAGPPYNANFFFLFNLIGGFVIVGVIVIAIFGALYVGRKVSVVGTVRNSETQYGYVETLRSVVLRAVRVYIFVAALILLGGGLTPLILWYFTKIPAYGLYWVNIVSAVVDNATLTAAEIGPILTATQISSALMGLLIAGGMLIPGNIPNIVAAGRLKITSKEWARTGLIMGIIIMVVYFIILIPYYLS